MGPVFHRARRITGQHAGGLPAAVIIRREFPGRFLRIAAAVLPHPADNLQHEQMGADGSHVDVPQRIRLPLQHPLQFPDDQGYRYLQHRDMVGRLQIIEADMIIDPVPAGFLRPRHGVHPGIQVFLPPGDHPAESVVPPDLHDLLRNRQESLAVQPHQLAVQIRGKEGVRILRPGQLHLPAHHGGNKAPPFLIRIETGAVVVPESVIALAPEADAPQNPLAGIPVNRFLPERFVLFRIQDIGGRQVRIHPSEHPGAQQLAVVLRHPQAHLQRHIRQHPSVIFPVRTRNHHVPAAAQNGFKGPLPYLVPERFLHMPAGEQHLVIHKPAAEPHTPDRRFPLLRGHGNRLPLFRPALHPPVQGLHSEQPFAQGEQAVNDAQIVPAGDPDFRRTDLRPVRLRRQPGIDLRPDRVFRAAARQRFPHIPLQNLRRVPDRGVFFVRLHPCIQ